MPITKFGYSKIITTFAPQSKETVAQHIGEMAEWSIAAVLKTVEPRGSGGSNPSFSAINAENQQIAKQTPNFTPQIVKLGVFVLFKETAEQYKIARQFFRGSVEIFRGIS